MSGWFWFGLGMLAGSMLSAVWAITHGNRLLEENRHLMRLLADAYAELVEIERSKGD